MPALREANRLYHEGEADQAIFKVLQIHHGYFQFNCFFLGRIWLFLNLILLHLRLLVSNGLIIQITKLLLGLLIRIQNIISRFLLLRRLTHLIQAIMIDKPKVIPQFIGVHENPSRLLEYLEFIQKLLLMHYVMLQLLVIGIIINYFISYHLLLLLGTATTIIHRIIIQIWCSIYLRSDIHNISIDVRKPDRC